jgi:hypothetical protein
MVCTSHVKGERGKRGWGGRGRWCGAHQALKRGNLFTQKGLQGSGTFPTHPILKLVWKFKCQSKHRVFFGYFYRTN